MLNKSKHQLIMTEILKGIYTDVEISSIIGFKGGTAAYFFYELPRFSVDLDFDLLKDSAENKNLIFSKIENICKRYGDVKEKYIKRFTILLLLSYGDKDHNIKIEISTRVNSNSYELKKYLGIPILAAKSDSLFTNKLVALCGRRKVAMRDVYDIYFFMKNNFEINKEILKFWTGKDVADYLNDCIKAIEDIKESEILQGLGEVLDEKEKTWVRNNLKKEALILMKIHKKVYEDEAKENERRISK